VVIKVISRMDGFQVRVEDVSRRGFLGHIYAVIIARNKIKY